MIFYYTSTGNSQWVAEKLEHLLQESLFSINAIAKAGFNACDYEFEEGERLIFVFPVHAWNVPAVVATFINKLTFEGKPSAVYVVCTCGDDCGLTDQKVTALLKEKNLQLNACFSIQMPNDYVLLPGFDVDPVKLQTVKMEGAVLAVKTIAGEIEKGTTSNGGRYTPGSFAWLKTKALYPLFKRFLFGHTPFYATDACVSCGLCVQMCPVNNIRMQPKTKPQWRDHCIQCSACYHHCPKNAVQYGKVTKDKGQYLNTHVEFDDYL